MFIYSWLRSKTLPVIMAFLGSGIQQIPQKPKDSEEKTSYIYEYYKVAKSAATFHISRWYNAWRFGSVFSCNMIVEDSRGNNKPQIIFANGKIIDISDGKSCPIFLGSMPGEFEHLQQIREKGRVAPDDIVGIYTLNRDFERRWGGLNSLVKDPAGNVKFLKYSTTDYSAPSFIDLLRAVRDLKKRDDQKIAYVHCKAGRGRSAVTVGAYLIAVCHEAHEEVTPIQIEEFLIFKRDRVSLGSEHRQALVNFQEQLKKAGSFELLYSQNQQLAELRDSELYSHWL